ncbi:MAG: hypothetical protein QOI91_2915 [Solirubrobacteraceae bacterium]|nr:hypothetical protein [Solirubrobacteraceae bacterium]
MAVVGHHILLGLQVAALGAAAVRVASLAVPRGPLRALAAVPLFAGAAVLETLLLGLAGLGADPWATPAAALASWAAARAFLPRPRVSVAAELGEWWREAPLREVALAGATAGLGCAFAAWLVRYPLLGPDGISYHLPEVVRWVRDGHPGSRHAIVALLPVDSYPVTHEVLISWLVGTARGLAVIQPLQVAFGALLAGSVTTGLRELGVGRLVRRAAAGALLVCTLLLDQWAGPLTDLPALAWLACTAALCAGALRRPALLAPAALAAGLAVGTKTTTLLAAIALLAATGLARRRALPWRPLGLALAAAVGVGGVWYLRNLADHGSPFWPLVAAPWGDPVPPFLAHFDVRFAADPVSTFDARRDEYEARMAGAVALLAGALLAPLLSARRAVVAASVAAAGLVAVWMLSPYTGLPGRQVFALLGSSTYRYLLPAILAATVAVALAGARPGRGRIGALAVFAAAIAWSLRNDLRAGFPYLPSVGFLAGALAAGALAGLGAAIALRARRGSLPDSLAGPLLRARGVRFPGLILALRRLPRLGPALPAGAGLLAAVALGLASDGYVRRHADTGFDDAALVRWFADRPGFTRGASPVSGSPVIDGLLTGDRLRHPVELVRDGEPCARTRERARRGWVVVRWTGVAEWDAVALRADRCLRGAGRPAFESFPFRVYGSAG